MAESTLQRRSMADDPEFVASVRFILDAMVALDQDETRLLSVKVRPHKLLWTIDVTTSLGTPPDTYPSHSGSLVYVARNAFPDLCGRNLVICEEAWSQAETSKRSTFPTAQECSKSWNGHTPNRSKVAPSNVLELGHHSMLISSPVLGEHSKRNSSQDTFQGTEISNMPDDPPPTRYLQVFKSMETLFEQSFSVAKLPVIIQMGDNLVREDVVSFLKDDLTQWKCLWNGSDLPRPLASDNATDRFVKISRCVAAIEERSSMDRIRIMLQKVLQYSFYLRCLDEIRHETPKMQQKRKRGVRDAVCAADHLLQCLYQADWNDIGTAEKQKRRNLLHKQKHIGKRLHMLSNYMGLGILLLGSSTIMSRINNTEFTDKMFEGFVTYTLNMYLDIPLLGKKLDDVVRRMISGQAIQEGEYPKNFLYEIDQFMQRRDDIVPPLAFRLIEPVSIPVESLELYPDVSSM